MATRLSNICCERLTEDNALSVIFEIIKNCNRGLASIELIKVAICVVLNLVKVSFVLMTLKSEKVDYPQKVWDGFMVVMGQRR